MNPVWQFIKRHKQFSFATALLSLIFLITIFAEWLAPYDPMDAVMGNSLLAPNSEHLFGTDRLGRDVLSRVLVGARFSLGATLLMVLIIFFLGTLLGMIAGFFGGIIDSMIMRMADLMISFPGLVLAIAIAGVLGPNLTNAIIAITAVSWSKYARLSRSLVLQIKESQYMQAAVVTGTGNVRMIQNYLLPNILPTMVVTAVTDIGTMMMEIAALSFLGFGAQAPNPEWGLMLNEGRTQLMNAPWLMIFPGLAIVFAVVAFNIFGDGVSELLETKQN